MHSDINRDMTRDVDDASGVSGGRHCPFQAICWDPFYSPSTLHSPAPPSRPSSATRSFSLIFE